MDERTPRHAYEETALWPPWGFEDGVQGLAKYVSVVALAGSGLGGVPERLRSGPDRAAADRRAAQHLFGVLRAKRIRYAREPWLPPSLERQQIRDPQWIVDDEYATCLDLALAFASMCLDSELEPLLAVQTRTPRHAFVAIRLGERAREAPAGTQPGDAGAVYRLSDPERFAREVAEGRLLPVECVNATVERIQPFEQAVQAATAGLKEGIVLVDVAAALDGGGVMPYSAPRGRPAITTFAPRGSRPQQLFASQARLLERLAGRRGTVIILAPQGQGKSTVAREVLHAHPHGAAWFLDASQQTRLVESLADAERNERGASVVEQSKVSRGEFADNALLRLHGTKGPWLVVLDNADVAPAELGRSVPRPREAQLVVVTTINDAWRQVPDVEVLELDAIDDADIVEQLGTDRLLELVRGRALLVDSLGRFLDSGATVDDILRHDPGEGVEDADRGPVAHYRAILARAGDDERLRGVAEAAALLPPDRIPLAVLERAAGGDAHPAASLVEQGLLTIDEERRIVRMHRLLGAAVRAVMGDRAHRAVLELAADDEARETLDRWANVATIEDFAKRMKAAAAEAVGTDRELGVLLHDVAAVLETKGNTAVSSELFTLAEQHLDDSRDDDLERLAGCWHGRARREYQQHADDPERLAAALVLARRAEETVERLAGYDAAGRYVAMCGLIEKAAARHAPGQADQLRQLYRALATLEDADDRRQRSSATTDEAELLRSRYNLAGIRIDIAKRDPEHARVLLEDARDIYEEVQDARVALYRRTLHPHIAACAHGRGIAAYYHALLVDRDPAARTRSLREATRDVLAGLHQREELGGDVESVDVHKSSDVLAKVALARRALPVLPQATWGELVTEARAELHDAGLVD